MMSHVRYVFILMGILCLFVAPVVASVNIIGTGDTVFIGEEGLNVSATLPAGYHQIAWISPGQIHRPAYRPRYRL
jgi:hypothetical protein